MSQALAKSKLRFPEFIHLLNDKKLGDIMSVFNGYAFKSHDISSSGVRWLKIADVGIQKIEHRAICYLPSIFSEKHSKFKLNKNDVVIALTRPILGKKLKIALIDESTDGALLNQRVGKILSNENLMYVYYLMQCNRVITNIINSIAGTDPPNLAPSDINYIPILIGCEKEQQKIASFLTSVDSKISQLTEKHRLLKEYKKGVMQQIFSQQLRFKDDDGKAFPEWEYTRLSSFLLEHKCKNKNQQFKREDVLSVSGEYGVVNQIKHLGRSYAGEFITQYNIVNKEDVVYTKSPLKANPYGIIKTNLGNAGIVSTLYAVYSCKKNASPKYLNYYFSLNDNVNRYLEGVILTV